MYHGSPRLVGGVVGVVVELHGVGRKKPFVVIAVCAENVISFTFDWNNTHVQRCCSGGCGWLFLNELVFFGVTR